MDALKAICTRKTIRDFAPKEVSWEIIRKLIEAGLNAPSNDHLRQWEFIVLQDKGRRRELAAIIKAPKSREGTERIVNAMGLKDPVQREMYINAIPKQQSMLMNAGCIIVPAFYMSYPLTRLTNISALNYFASIWCCIENILITASSLGIYGVTRIPIDRPEELRIKELLGIPENYVVPCCLALGYPAGDAVREKQLDYDIEAKIHHNRW